MKRSAKNISPTRVALSLLLGLGLPQFPAHATAPVALAALNQLPLYFEANHGQTDAAFPFLARGRDCNFFVAPNQAVLTLTRCEVGAETTRDQRAETPGDRIVVTHQLRFDFPGANTGARLTGAGELPGRVNYFLGHDPKQWGQNASLFQQVRVAQIYPGVDLVYYGNDRRLEYDFVVAPQADPAAIAIRFSGADRITIDAQGSLVFTLGDREISQPKPIVYQTVNGVRKEIAGSYQLGDRQTVTFKLGTYDRELPLVIDPILSYSRFFGGTGADTGWDMAIQKEGTHEYVYVTGETMSAGLPITTGTNYGGGTTLGGDAFVAKFDLSSSSTNPAYFTYLGGKAEDAALAIAVDSDGNAYITGFTTSTNFPTLNPIPTQTNLHGAPHPAFGIYPSDAFVAKLYSTGTLAFATFLGGSTNDVGIGIAVNATRDIFLTGYTRSTDFPTNNALHGALQNADDAFVAKLTSAGASYAFVYSTYLGGTNADHGEGIAADDAGLAYVTGYTSSTNFPITAGTALQKFLNNPATNATNHVVGAVVARDAFVTLLSADGSANLFSSFLGGQFADEGYRITLDAGNNFYVCGASSSTNFPFTSALTRDVTNAGSFADAFVTKYKFDGSTNYYSALFGGTNLDQAWDVSVGTNGFAHVVGVSYSSNFPTTNTVEHLRATNSGAADVFVSVLNSAGTAFVRSALLGGKLNDFGYAIETDAAGDDYIIGTTYSTNFPALAPFTSKFAGSNDVFIAKIGSEPVLHIAPVGDQVFISWQGYGFQLQVNTNGITNHTWTNVTGSPTFDEGTYSGYIDAVGGPVFYRLRR